MTDLLAELDEIPKWVKLVHDALVAADVTDASGAVHISAQDLTLRMIAARRGRAGIQRPGELAPDQRRRPAGRHDRRPIRATSTTRSARRPDICSSTPVTSPCRPRLDVLSFRRSYASQQLRDGAFGPGWWSWAECHAATSLPTDRSNTSGLTLSNSSFAPAPMGVSCIARISTFDVARRRPMVQIPLGTALSQSEPDVDVRRRPTRRGRRPVRRASGVLVGPSRPPHRDHPRQRTCTDAPLAGAPSRRDHVVRRPAGRVRVQQGWRSSSRVDNARSPERYVVDADGRILSVTDADGIQTITMTYDDEGRVLAQVSETGFMTRFNYDEASPHDAV